MFSCAPLLALSYFVHVSSVGALWIPEELKTDPNLWAPEDFVIKRDVATCGGDSSLTQCGTGFPSDFCCSTQTQCLLLNTTSAIKAALCCPEGQDCSFINPISCDQTLQNATSSPASALHADPPSKLATCGTACCPMGYSCQGSTCFAQTAGETASPTSSSSTTSIFPATSSIAASSTATSAPESSTPNVLESNDSHSFSGKSFAAGFIPGIAIGVIFTAIIAWVAIRKRRQRDESGFNEKHRDTLTDLGPDMFQRPTYHERSISEPIPDASSGHRTDFSRRSPPDQRNDSLHEGLSGYAVQISSSGKRDTYSNRAQQQQPSTGGSGGWLSHSPFVNQVQTPVATQSPLPNHLKRGTLSFQISPVRALKKQRSMHSLRRQITNATMRSTSTRGGVNRTQSTETIKVQFSPEPVPPQIPPSNFGRPEHHLLPHEPLSATTWKTTSSGVSSEESTPIEEEGDLDFSTPTRPGRNSNNVAQIGETLHSPPSQLGSPYTPSNYPVSTMSMPHARFESSSIPPVPALNLPKTNNSGNGGLLAPPVPSSDSNRDPSANWRNTTMTTFSGVMRSAGMTKSMLYGEKDTEGREQENGKGGFLGLGKGKAKENSKGKGIVMGKNRRSGEGMDLCTRGGDPRE